jgi:alanine dehydrogenase
VVADDALAEGVNVVEGAVTYGPVAESLGVPFSPLRSLL